MGRVALLYGLAFLFSVAGSVPQGNAACVGTAKIKSPDGQLIARIAQTGRTGCGESRVEIANKSGQIVASGDYRSSDGSHGFGIEEAAWTADSRFFVFSMSSSGGHQADRFPIFVFLRQENRLISLSRNLQGDAISPDFKIVPPHEIDVFVSEGVMERRDLAKVTTE